MKHLIEKCGQITKSKGFDCTQHLKQLLLIADEVNEAIEHITIGGETSGTLRDFYSNFFSLFKVYKSYRKNSEMPEITTIANKKLLAEELADIVIRVFSYSSINEIDLETAIIEKIEKNEKREFLHGQKF